MTIISEMIMSRLSEHSRVQTRKNFFIFSFPLNLSKELRHSLVLYRSLFNNGGFSCLFQ